MEKWKRKLTVNQIDEIKKIVSGTKSYSYFNDM